MKDINEMLESLSDDEWSKIVLKLEAKRAHMKADTFNKMKREAIQFGNWILKHNVEPGYDESQSTCWVRKYPNSEEDINVEYLTSQELYLKYFLGEWDEIEDDEYLNENDGSKQDNKRT
jgi:hypothetical protein